MAGKTFEPLSNPSVVDRIVNRITDGIISGDLKPGEKIPTETELSVALGVGRNSVREAIKILVSLGVLIIRRAEGTFVAARFHDCMLDPLLYSMIMARDDLRDIVELRRVFETGLLELVIRNATDLDILHLEETLTHMQAVVARCASDDGATMGSAAALNPLHTETKHVPDSDLIASLMSADIAFHHALVAIARNRLIEKVSDIIERLTIPSRRSTILGMLENGTAGDMILYHAELLELIRKRDTKGISDAMIHHFSHWIQRFED